MLKPHPPKEHVIRTVSVSNVGKFRAIFYSNFNQKMQLDLDQPPHEDTVGKWCLEWVMDGKLPTAFRDRMVKEKELAIGG